MADTRQVGILRRRNAIHKILKFRHVVSFSLQTRARECRRQRRVFPESCARLVSSLSRAFARRSELRGAYISIFAVVSSSPLLADDADLGI